MKSIFEAYWQFIKIEYMKILASYTFHNVPTIVEPTNVPKHRMFRYLIHMIVKLNIW